MELSRELAAPDPKARLAALKATLDRGDARACPVIAEAIAAESHPQVRAAMAMVLGRLGGMSQAGLLARLTGDRDARVRLRAVEALAALKDPACYATLVRVMSSEEEAAVRDAAAHFLMARGKEQLLALFKQMVVADKAWKREAAVRACQMFNSASVVPLLKHAATKDESEPIRECARAGLKRLAALGNAAAATVEQELAAAEAPAPVDLSAELARSEESSGLAFNDTYTGQKMPRVEIEDHFGAQDEEPPEPARPAPPPARAPQPARALQPAPVAPSPTPAPPPKSKLERRPVAPLPFDGGMIAGPRNPASDGKPATKTRPCPVCGEEIAVVAKKCRFCNEVFDLEGLKAVQGSADQLGTMPIPTALSVLTCFQYVIYAIMIFASFVGMLSGAPEGVFMLALSGALFYMVAKVRAGSATAWRIMVGLQTLGTAGSIVKPFQLVFNLIVLGVLMSEDVRNYCSK